MANVFGIKIKIENVQDVSATAKAFKELNTALKANSKILNNLSKQSNELSSSINSTALGLTRTAKASLQLNKSLNSSKSALSSNASGTENLRKENIRLGVAFGGVAASAIIAGVAVKSFLDAYLSVAKAVTKTAAEFEKFGLVLENLEGSSKKGQESLNWIKDFAAVVPFTTQEVADAFITLKNYGIEPTTGALESMVDVALGMGKPLQQGVEALADAMSGENERLKEYGIKSSKIADETKFTWTNASGKTKDIIVKNNKDILASTIQAIFNSKYAGQAKKFEDSYTTAISGMETAWTDLKLAFSENSGIFETTKGLINALTEAMVDFKDSAEFNDIANGFASATEIIISSSVFAAKAVISISSLFIKSFNIIAQGVNGFKFLLESTSALIDSFVGNLKLTAAWLNRDKDAKKAINKEIEDNAAKHSKRLNDLADENKKKQEDYGKIDDLSVALKKSVDAFGDSIRKKEKLNKEAIASEALKLSEEAKLNNKRKEEAEKFLKDNGAKISDDKAVTDKGLALYYEATLSDTEKFNREMKALRSKLTAENLSSAQINEVINKKETEFYKEINDQKIDDEISFNEAMGDTRTAFNLSMKKLHLELINAGASAAEANKVIHRERNKFNKEALAEEIALEDQRLQALLIKYKAEKDIIKANETEIAILRNSLRGSGQPEDVQNTIITNYVDEGNSERRMREAKLLNDTESIYHEEYLNRVKQIEEADISEAARLEALKLAYTEYEEGKRLQIKDTMTLQESALSSFYNASMEAQSNIMSTAEITNDVITNTMSSLEGSLTNFFDASSETFLDFRELTKSIVKDVLKEISKIIAKQLVLMAIKGATAGFTGGFFAKGGAFDGGVQAFADGGVFTNSVVSTPTAAPMALFGEAGPEAIMPLTRDSSGSLGVKMVGGNEGSSLVQNIIINNNAAGVRVSESSSSNGDKILTIEEIDSSLAQKVRSGDSKMMTMMQNKYKGISKK